MIAKTITYVDFDGNEQSDKVYFNLSRVELMRFTGELSKLERIINSDGVSEDNVRDLFGIFENVILTAYGKKSPDGKRFIKDEKSREEFEQSAAYAALIESMAMDTAYAQEFIGSLMGSNVAVGSGSKTE